MVKTGLELSPGSGYQALICSGIRTKEGWRRAAGEQCGGCFYKEQPAGSTDQNIEEPRRSRRGMVATGSDPCTEKEKSVCKGGSQLGPECGERWLCPRSLLNTKIAVKKARISK